MTRLFMFALMSLQISVMASATESVQSYITLKKYLNRHAEDICVNSNKKFTTEDLVSLLEKGAHGPGCWVFRAKMTSIEEAKTSTFDGYTGPIAIIQLIKDQGLTDDLKTSTLRIRGGELCATEDGGRLRVAYKIATSEPAPYQSRIGSLLYGAVRGFPEEMERTTLFEFVGDSLTYLGDSYQQIHIGGAFNNGATGILHEKSECGNPFNQ